MYACINGAEMTSFDNGSWKYHREILEVMLEVPLSLVSLPITITKPLAIVLQLHSAVRGFLVVFLKVTRES